jgi:hypothetical protein
VTLEGGVAGVEYPNLVWTDGTSRAPSFTNFRTDATLFGEYRFTDSFGLNATLRYSSNIGNTILPVTEGPNSATYAMEWERFEAYLGVRFFM